MSPLCSDSGHCSQEMLRRSSCSPSDSATSEARSTSLPTTVLLSSARKASGGSPLPTTPTVSLPSSATPAGSSAAASGSSVVCTRSACCALVSTCSAGAPEDDAAADRADSSMSAELVHADSSSAAASGRAGRRVRRRCTRFLPGVRWGRGRCSRAEARRVGLGLLDRLGAQAPAVEHLAVGAVLYRVVQRGG